MRWVMQYVKKGRVSIVIMKINEFQCRNQIQYYDSNINKANGGG